MIPPSTYSWMLPTHVDLAIIDKMASEGTFPTINGLWPALMYGALFGIIRMILQQILFSVS